MADNTPDPVEPSDPTATQAQQDLIARMAELATEITGEVAPLTPTASPAPSPSPASLPRISLAASAPPPSAGQSPDALAAMVNELKTALQQDMADRKERLARIEARLDQAPAKAASPETASGRGLETAAEEIRGLRSSVETLVLAFARERAATQEALVRLEGKTSAAPTAAPASQAAPESVRALQASIETLRADLTRDSGGAKTLTAELAVLEKHITELEARLDRPAVAPEASLGNAADLVRGLQAAIENLRTGLARDNAGAKELSAELAQRQKRIAELEARLGQKEQASVPDARLEAMTDLMRSLQTSIETLRSGLARDDAGAKELSVQLARREKRIAELETRLDRPEPFQETASEARVEAVAEMVRGLQSSLELLGSTMARDLASVQTRLDSFLSRQHDKVRGAPLERNLVVPASANLSAGIANVEDLRQELLGPMASMKDQLLELTLSYHQLSLRLAVLAASERHAGPELLE